MPRYAGLPSRPPANMMLYQPVGMSGQWAYRDLWHTNGLRCPDCDVVTRCTQDQQLVTLRCRTCFQPIHTNFKSRSEEHTSELQSRFDLVCRLLLEKKNRVENQILC